jgi:hypothetical protein
MWCTVTWLCCITSLLSCPCKVIKFSIIFEALAIIFEARTVILEARGAIWTISKIVLIFNDKKVLRDPPIRKIFELAVLLELSLLCPTIAHQCLCLRTNLR